MNTQQNRSETEVLSGNIYIFQAFDIGDDINLEGIRHAGNIAIMPLSLPKYFKKYHMPLAIEPPPFSAHCISVKLHSFGALSLTYKTPFVDTLHNLRKNFNDIVYSFKDQSLTDAKTIFKKVEHQVVKANFFDIRSTYVLIQVNPQPDRLDLKQFQSEYNNIIASTLRFETEILSEEQTKEILASAVGYFRGERVIIDTDAAFAYDETYEEILDLLEFANIQRLELQYFDRVLDQQLNRIYAREVKKLPISSYIPLISLLSKSPTDMLSQLKVDISVIIERLENSIKLSGEPYFTELYNLLVDKLDLISWRTSIERKLSIVQDIQNIYQHKIDATREDTLSVLIVILILIEVVVATLDYLK
ncbi:MAG TPA: hypothetical protein VGW78_03850 [Candidatus Babeliales bacterium]|jgi:hypothetical protein|nr:hypothetical protein [Candidatus Babeliales bacterium]